MMVWISNGNKETGNSYYILNCSYTDQWKLPPHFLRKAQSESLLKYQKSTSTVFTWSMWDRLFLTPSACLFGDLFGGLLYLLNLEKGHPCFYLLQTSLLQLYSGPSRWNKTATYTKRCCQAFNTFLERQPHHTNPCFLVTGVSELILRFYCSILKPYIVRLLPISVIW